MNIEIRRMWLAPLDTIGQLLIDGRFECFTLEDTVREPGVKVPGQTAIPVGTYPLTITPSQRFTEDLPLLDNVPGFTGIRIHAGNTHEDTEGCILVGAGLSGTGPGPSFIIGGSRRALNALLPKLREGLAGGTVTVTVTNP